MHADTNLVTFANIAPDTNPVTLTDFLDVDDQVISVASTTPMQHLMEYQQLGDLLKLIVKLFIMIALE